MSDWYDHPEYFELLFSDETDAEVDFFQAAVDKHAKRRVTRVIEPGCGGGRVLVALAELGFEVAGIDLNHCMVRYANEQLGAFGCNGAVSLGDMRDFQVSSPSDAAICTFNTFRHLLTETDAVKHLESVASALQPGGIYVLGFHCIPLDAEEEEEEHWEAEDQDLHVKGHLTVIDFDRSERRERLRIEIEAKHAGGATHNVCTEFDLRLYTHDEAADLFVHVRDLFEIVGIYDFDYDIDEPREIDEDLTDAVFILRRK